jgi:hypothetical protein
MLASKSPRTIAFSAYPETNSTFNVGREADRQPDHVAVTNELVIGGIGQYESVLGPLK